MTRRVWIVALLVACALEVVLWCFASNQPLVFRWYVQVMILLAGMAAVITFLIGLGLDLSHMTRRWSAGARRMGTALYVLAAVCLFLLAAIIGVMTAVGVREETGVQYKTDDGVRVVEMQEFFGTRTYHEIVGWVFLRGEPIHRGLAPCTWTARGVDGRYWCNESAPEPAEPPQDVPTGPGYPVDPNARPTGELYFEGAAGQIEFRAYSSASASALQRKVNGHWETVTHPGTDPMRFIHALVVSGDAICASVGYPEWIDSEESVEYCSVDEGQTWN